MAVFYACSALFKTAVICHCLITSLITFVLAQIFFLSDFGFFQTTGGLAQAFLCRLGGEYIHLPSKLSRKLL